MRLLVALLLVASVLHTQLAVGCHCQHALDAASHSTDAAGHCYWHGDAVGGHVHYASHRGSGVDSGDSVSGDGVSGDGVSGDGVSGDGVSGDGVSGDDEHPLPSHAPCDNCPECAAADPVGLRIEASSELHTPVQLTVWVAPLVEMVSATVRHSQLRQSAPPDGVRSLLACGTLLRI